MPSRIHSIIPKIAIGVGLLGLVLGVAGYVMYTQPYEPASDTDIFAVVEGRWAWTTADSGCTNDWHRVTFTPDRAVMTIAASKPYEGADGKLDSIVVYDILSHTLASIRGAIRGETRVTDAGEPVVWDLVLRSPNHYAWHRTDWFRGALTRDIQRCP